MYAMLKLMKQTYHNSHTSKSQVRFLPKIMLSVDA